MNGRADFREAIGQVRALEASLAGLQKTIIANSNALGKTNKYQSQMESLNKIRTAMQGNISTLETYRLRQGDVLTAEDAWAKKIREGKGTFADMYKNRGMFNTVLKDQLALQKAVGLGWTRSSKTGKMSVDMFIPETLPAELNNFRNRMGLFSQMVNSASGEMVNWGKNTQWAGRQLMVGFTVPLGIAAAAMGKMAYDLDKEVTQVVKVYGDASSAINSNAQDIRATAIQTAEAAARVYGQSAKDTLGIMAELAASGKAGQDLQQSTMATTRAAVLGELDWQDAVKASITMQSVYHASQEDLANNWNYINAMENQTVLSAQDFVTAIPKVAGVMNELGGTLKDTGALLTAFKASGIDAAEGANALKSINFRTVAAYGKGVDTFNAKTGKDLKAMIRETNGETIPTLLKFADSIKNLSNADKMAVTRDVFGIYQGSKALMLLDQMVSKTDQWQQALDVANNTNIENAAIAQQELDRQSDQPFMKLNKAVAALQVNLGKMGEAFLPPLVAAVDLVGKLVTWFNGLNSGVKTVMAIFAGGLALAGPIVMLVGLFANLLGTIGKLGSRLVLMTTGWKNLSEEEKLQQIIGSKTAELWDTETTAATRLTLSIREMTAALVEARGAAGAAKESTVLPSIGPLTREQARAERARAREIYKSMPPVPVPTPAFPQDKNGRYYNPNTGRKVKTADAVEANDALTASYRRSVAARKEEALAAAQQERAERAETAAREAAAKAAQESAAAETAAAEAAQARMLKATRIVSGAALGIGLLSSQIGSLTGMSEGAAMALNTIATVGMFAPGFLVSKTKAFGGWIKGIVSGVLTAVPAIGNISRSVGGAIKSTAVSMLGYLKTAGPIIAAVGVAAIIMIQKWNNEIDAQRKKTEDALNFAKNTADILGYSYTNAAGLDPNTIKDGAKATEVIAAKIREKNPEMASNFAEEAFSYDAGKKTGEKYGAAIAAGVDAKMHGATVDQAKSTTRAALAIMGKTFDTDAKFEAWITPRIDFDSANSMMKEQTDYWKTQLQTAFTEDPLNFGEMVLNGDQQITQDAQTRINKIGKDIWDNLYATPKGERRAVIEKMANENDQFLKDAYEKAMKNNPTLLGNMGINNVHDFAGALNDNKFVGGIDLGISNDEFAKLKKTADGVKALTMAIAKESGVSDKAAAQMQIMWDLMNPQFSGNTFVSYLDEVPKASDAAAGATAAYDAELNNALQSGQALTNEKIAQIQTDIRIADGTYALGDAVQYFGDVSRGASIDAEKFNEKLQEMGFNSTVTLDSISASFKNIYSGAQDHMFAEAARQFDAAQQAAMDNLQQRGQASLDALDKQGEDLDKKQEGQTKALEDRLNAAKKAFDKGWEDRKKREAAVYDARIQKIEDTIKAEQDAEALRQKIFEAEQTRIQRLAEMYNTNIDINTAINTGKLDEAAKLSTNATAQQAQWATSDAAGASQSASEKRIEDLNKQKDAISKAKDARMEALAAIEDAEKEAFSNGQDRQKQALKDTQDAAKKELDIQKKKIQQENADAEKQLRDDQAAKKRALDDQLAEMRAFLPKNKAQLLDQAVQLEKVYDGFGVVLTAKGQKWGGEVAGALKTNVAREGNALKSTVNWSDVGKDIANAMINGAFGMSPTDFAKWLNGGEAPKGSLYNPVVPTKYRTQMRDVESRHSGGVIGMGGGSRTGYSGEQKPGETMINALVGEGMVNRKGMSIIGKAGLDYINSGGGAGRKGMGGGGMPAMSQGVPGSIIGATTRVLVQNAIGAAYNKRMGVSEDQQTSGIGKNIGVTAGTPQWMNNAIAAFTPSQVYQSGRVVYLGHDGVNRGGDYTGLVRPVAGPVASEFGPRNLFGMSFHNGIDIMAAIGTPISAAKGGRVIFTGWDTTGYGNYTEIQAADGSMYGYGHQSAINVRAGQTVGTGQTIGLIGNTGNSTGPHLHFQIGNHGNWFNPRQVMPQLDTGGFIRSEGLANLHKDEVVVTAPLTKKFEQGVNNFADGGNSTYNVNLNFDGAVFNKDVDVENAVEAALRKIDRKNGGTRVIGGKR